MAPTNDIKISQNTLLAGINPFKFEVLSVVNGSEVNISSDINFDKLATVIEYSDMTTTAVDIDTDGRVGENFTITLREKFPSDPPGILSGQGAAAAAADGVPGGHSAFRRNL